MRPSPCARSSLMTSMEPSPREPSAEEGDSRMSTIRKTTIAHKIYPQLYTQHQYAYFIVCIFHYVNHIKYYFNIPIQTCDMNEVQFSLIIILLIQVFCSSDSHHHLLYPRSLSCFSCPCKKVHSYSLQSLS